MDVKKDMEKFINSLLQAVLSHQGAGRAGRGGTHSCNYGYKPGTFYGGKEALKEGIFSLTKGTVFNIVVGQRGGYSVDVKGAGPRKRPQLN